MEKDMEKETVLDGDGSQDGTCRAEGDTSYTKLNSICKVMDEVMWKRIFNSSWR